jgi:outer membrane lipoprotein-sorting protein
MPPRDGRCAALKPHLIGLCTDRRHVAAAGGETPGVNRLLRRCLAVGAALVLLIGISVASAAPVAAPLTTQDTLELQRIAAYLNSIRTMTADFQQVANNGATTTGRLWVARPGRMRFEYNPPDPIILLADATSVYYWDRQLNQISKYDLRDTPAWFFLRDPISFGSDVTVTQFQAVGSAARVTVVETAHPDQGSLTLVFTENPLALRQWIVVDQQGKTTTVSLSDLQFGMALDPRLFQYQFLFTGSRY